MSNSSGSGPVPVDTGVSPLVRRLLRRATEPVGVIDVRAAQERHQRATAWPRQHVSLLERCVGRAATDAAPQGGAGPASVYRAFEASRPSVEASAARATTGQFGQELIARAMRGLDAGADARPIREHVRSRDDARAVDSSRGTAPPSSGGATELASRGEVVRGRAMHAVRSQGTTLTLASTKIPVVSAAPPAGIQRKELSGVDITAPHATSAPGSGTMNTRIDGDMTAPPPSPPNAQPAATPLVAREIEPAPFPSSHVLIQRRATVSGAPPRDSRPGSTNDTALGTGSGVPLPLRDGRSTSTGTVRAARSLDPMVAPISTTGESGPLTRRPDLPGARTMERARATEISTEEWHHSRPSVSATPVSVATDNGMPVAPVLSARVARAPLSGADWTAGATRSARAAATGLERPVFASPVATPVIQRSAAGPLSGLVWQRAGAPGIGRDAAGDGASVTPFPLRRTSTGGTAAAPVPASVIARASAPASESIMGPGNLSGPPSTGSMETGRKGPDLTQIVEQVTRSLFKQIALERERRGGARWP